MSRRWFGNLSALVLLALTAFVAACGGNPPPAPPPPPPPPPAPVVQPPPPPPPPPAPQPPPPPPAPPTEEQLFARMTLEELNNQRPLTDVFFAYDQADLSEQARTSLQANANYLKRWASTRVTIEGHADSRGTNEYNFALGERRAAAVKDYLVGLGVDAGRLGVVSLGEERPVCTEETEACWTQNRRGHFVFTAK